MPEIDKKQRRIDACTRKRSLRKTRKKIDEIIADINDSGIERVRNISDDQWQDAMLNEPEA